MTLLYNIGIFFLGEVLQQTLFEASCISDFFLTLEQ